MNIFGITMELPSHLSVAWSAFIYLCISVTMICISNEIIGDYTSKSWRRILGRVIKYPAIILTILTAAWWIGASFPTVDKFVNEIEQPQDTKVDNIVDITEIPIIKNDTVFIEVHDTLYMEKSERKIISKW